MFSKSEMVELHWLIWKVKERLEKVGLDFNLTEYKDYGVSPWNHSISKEMREVKKGYRARENYIGTRVS